MGFDIPISNDSIVPTIAIVVQIAKMIATTYAIHDQNRVGGTLRGVFTALKRNLSRKVTVKAMAVVESAIICEQRSRWAFKASRAGAAIASRRTEKAGR